MQSHFHGGCFRKELRRKNEKTYVLRIYYLIHRRGGIRGRVGDVISLVGSLWGQKLLSKKSFAFVVGNESLMKIAGVKSEKHSLSYCQ